MRFIGQFTLVTLCFFWGLTAFAQEQTTEDPLVVQEKPKPYDVSHISEAVEMTDVVLRYCRELSNDSTIIANFEKEFDAIVFSYNPEKQDSIEFDFSDKNLWSLKDDKASWLELKAEWTEFSQSVKTHADANRTATDSLKRVEDKWLATKAMADTLTDVESVSATIDKALQQTAAMNQTLKEKLVPVLDLEARTSAQVLIVNDALSTLDALIKERGQNLFQRDSEPLFKALKHRDKNEEGFVTAMYSSFKLAFNELVSFAKANRWSVLYQLLTGLLLFVLMVFVNRHFVASDLYKDDDFAVARKVLGQPFISAFILTLISSQLFYGRMPILVRDLMLVLTILPIAILLPKILNHRLRFFVVFLFVLLVFDRIQGLLPAGHTNQRLLVGLMSILALVGFVFALRRNSELNQAIRENGRMIVVRIIQLYAVLIAGTILANLAGLFGLARLVTSGVILSFTLGVIVFLAASILKVLILFIVRSGLAGKLNILKKYNKDVERWAFLIINIYGIWLWFMSFLRGFALRNYAQEQLNTFLSTSWKFGEITLSVDNIVDFVLILAVFYIIANALQLILKEDVLKRFDMRKGITLAISILTRYIILLLGFVLAMSSAGISLSKLSLLIGALGVGIGFGLQSIVGNFVSGLVIIFERPIHIGDVVSTSSIEGEVIDIGLRSSRIRTWAGAEVIVPNMNLTVNEVTNWTFSDRNRRKEIFVLIENGPSPREVKSVIDGVLQAHEGLLDDPKPQAYFLGYEGNSLKFRLLIWLNENLLGTPSEVMLNLHDALEANGYKPYIPIQKLLVKQQDEANHFMPIIGKNKAEDASRQTVEDSVDDEDGTRS